MSKVDEYLDSTAVAAIARHIADAGGNEVFFVGRLNADLIVEAVQVYARGNKFSAPALLQVARQGDVVIHNHPTGTLRPSGADTHIASLLGNDGIGFYIVNNDASAIYVVIEPFEEKVRVPLDGERVAALLGDEGPISTRLEEYEYRPEQLEMVKAVCHAINEEKIAMIEAGTGTGKTLAYLLPAIIYAINNKERIVVSTNTINLQEQLIQKDLPFLQSVLRRPFRAVLVKGRSNYACKRKLVEADLEPDLFLEDSEKGELKSVLAWAKTSKDGSKSDLNFVPKPDVWEKIQSESDTSLKTKCPFYAECFFYSARRAAAIANILVANHHLLFSDLALRTAIGDSENAILPTYARIIFDEAHNVEEVATSYFGTRITFIGLQRVIGKLYRSRKGKESGLLPFISYKLNKHAQTLPYNDFIEVQQGIQEQGIEAVKKLQVIIEQIFEKLFNSVATLANVENVGANEVKLRLTSEVLTSEQWQNEILPGIERTVVEIRRFTSRLDKTVKHLAKLHIKMPKDSVSLTVDLQAQMDRLEMMAVQIGHVLLSEDDIHVRWVEIKEGYKQSKIVRLQSSPLEVSNILKESVYEKFKNVTMTSATLTVAGRFDYFKHRLGLDYVDRDRFLELCLPAPFDYEHQTLVAVPTDIPEPNSPQFAHQLPGILLQAIKASDGRAFVLFTSYGLLNKAYFALREEIERLGINLYKQGSENRSRLLRRFKDDVSSVLFATDSFWEGVDVHGESLASVIITKLPFRVPSEPIIEARIEAIEAGGGNAFMEYTVPQAAIKFRQGFGRLIRRKSDRGTVLVLDKRVIVKRYGRLFLQSLPTCRTFVGSSQEVFAQLRQFHA